jgi:hypothetical protein
LYICISFTWYVFLIILCIILTSIQFNNEGAKIDDSFSNKHGVFNFKIHGQVYHYIDPSLLPDITNEAKFRQIYLKDTDFQLENRVQRFNNLDKDLLRELQKAILSVNLYVKQLQFVSDLIKKDGNSDIRLTIKTNKDVDMRRYNAPASSEIAVLLPGDDMEASNRDIVLHKKGGGIIRINEFNAAYDPLHYVLLFPHGDQGYHFNIKPNQLPEVSMDIVQKLLMQPQP